MAKTTGMGSKPLSWMRDTRAEEPDVVAPDASDPAEKPRPVKKKRSADSKPNARDNSHGADVKSEVRKSGTSKGPKFETFDVKLSVLLRNDQLEFLERLTRETMGNRNRDSRKERITKNTVVRACLDALQGVEMDTGNIPDEEELLRRIQTAMGKG